MSEKRSKSTLPVLIIVIVIASIFFIKKNNTESTPVEANSNELIMTTFYPTTYFAQTISNSKVKVSCPCPEDEDAIFWMPEREIISDYQNASLVIINGAGFEKWVSIVSLPQEITVDSAANLDTPLIHFQNSTSHSHGPQGEHTHEGIDGHTWVDPLNAIIQADTIFKAMVKKYPQYETEFTQGHSKLRTQLESIHSQFEAISKDNSATPLLCSHPAYNYIARRYSWNIHNLDLDPQEKLDNTQIEAIKAIIKDHPAKTLIWESEPITENISIFEAIGIKSLVFSPCELLSSDEISSGMNYYTIMNDNIKIMQEAFTGNAN